MSVRLTASLSSTVRRNKRKRDILGSEVLHAAEIEQDGSAGGTDSDVSGSAKRREQKLEITNLIVAIEGEMAELSDITIGIRTVLSRMWDVVPENGTRLNRDGIAELLRFRKSIPPIVMISHLHSLFPSDPTFIDRELQRVAEEGLVRKMVVNQNAGDMVIESKDYFRILREMKHTGKASNVEAFDKFEDLLKSKPAVTRLAKEDLAEAAITEEEGIRDLLSVGFLVLSGIPGVYLISIPNVGSFLKLAFSTRKWMVNILAKTKWKEMLEKLIHERWDANVKARWREFRGVRFEWVMMEVKGGGWCEPFGTPGGRGWKLTGKKE